MIIDSSSNYIFKSRFVLGFLSLSNCVFISVLLFSATSLFCQLCCSGFTSAIPYCDLSRILLRLLHWVLMTSIESWWLYSQSNSCICFLVMSRCIIVWRDVEKCMLISTKLFSELRLDYGVMKHAVTTFHNWSQARIKKDDPRLAVYLRLWWKNFKHTKSSNQRIFTNTVDEKKWIT